MNNIFFQVVEEKSFVQLKINIKTNKNTFYFILKYKGNFSLSLIYIYIIYF